MKNPVETSYGLNSFPADKKRVKFFTPSDDLKNFVKYYWLVEVEDTTKSDSIAKISPSGYPEIIFHFGDSVSIHTSECHLRGETTHAIVAGQITQPVYINLNKDLNCLCVKLQPYALSSLFRINSLEFTNRAISLNEISSAIIPKQIYDELSETIDDSLKIAIIENHLRKLLNRNDNFFCPVTSFVIECFRNNSLKINELSQALKISSRSLERKIKENVGVSPKMLYRIIRFNKTYNLIKYNREINLQEITFLLGYFDLSHMIKEFKEFTGSSPLCYLKKENPYNSHFAGIL